MGEENKNNTNATTTKGISAGTTPNSEITKTKPNETESTTNNEDKNISSTLTTTETTETATETAIEGTEEELIENLYILPPKIILADDDKNTQEESFLRLKLPPLRMDEPVSSIKAVLSEVCGYAHISHYRLVLEKEEKLQKDDGTTPVVMNSSSNKKPSLIDELVHPYTSKGMILPPPALNYNTNGEEEIVLDDYSDLSSYASYYSKGYKCIRVVLESYNLAAVKDHILRIRSLLDGNCPHLERLMEQELQPESMEENGETKENGAIVAANAVSSTEKEERKEKKKRHKKNKKKSVKDQNKENQITDPNKIDEEEDLTKKAAQLLKELSDKIPNYPLDQPLTTNYSNLEYFYDYSCSSTSNSLDSSTNDALEEYITQMRKFDACTLIRLSINYNKNHPPTNRRKISCFDLAYIDVEVDGTVYYITAIPSGFYMNRSSEQIFDPRPLSGEECCYSHSLLDCVLLASSALQTAWSKAMKASKERAVFNNSTSSDDTPLYALYRIIKNAFCSTTSDQQLQSTSSFLLDSVILKPCWLLPSPQTPTLNNKSQSKTDEDLHYMTTCNNTQQQQQHLTLLELNTRCWNEEFQSGREMPRTTLQERIDRARVLHKVQVDFTDAALQGVKYISDGFIIPMNPSECYKSHVYLHNNIFFSRAVDAAQATESSTNAAVMETFKIAKGDAAARKSASRDVNCINILHKLDSKLGVYTLLTILVDYLGSRYVCQSVVPGILHGEKTHELLCGAVEANSPLIKNEDFHHLLLDVVGKHCRVATRNVPIYPLPQNEEKEDDEKEKTIEICVPMEAKGIQGSDKRKYILDLTRVTPRDANWVSTEEGGTGNWEKDDSCKTNNKIPKNLSDDEWTMAVLRPELITSLTQKKMMEFMELKGKEKKDKETKDKEEKEKDGNNDKIGEETLDEIDSNKNVDKKCIDNKEPKEKEEESSEKKETESSPSPLVAEAQKEETTEEEETEITNLTADQQTYLESLRFNVNVFLPNTKQSLKVNLTPEDYKLYTQDEENVRYGCNYLWNDVLVQLTQEVHENNLSQFSFSSLPVDGNSLKELLHSRGINLRYLGRLAQLAVKEEEDVEQTKLQRKSMPQCWLELLEVEMIARATKHLLNSYFIEMEEGRAGANVYPAQIVASVLSAILSKKEESAADTEKRLSKEEKTEEVDESFYTPNLYPCKNERILSRDRTDIWNDIEGEIGRRFRYSLHLFNRENTNSASNRVLYLPLLRRVCQKCGIRLASRDYAVGGKSICTTASFSSYGINTSALSFTSTYPISPKDILDILPTVKHSGASSSSSSNTGFTPCTFSSSASCATTLHIMLPDATSTQQAAHIHYKNKSLSKALDAAQDAASLYQRVIDSALHVNIAHCLDLSAIILFAAQELDLAAGNAARSLALYVQLFGPDCMEVVTCHTTLAHILLTSSSSSCANSAGDTISFGIQHLRNALYLMQVMGGSNYIDISSLYHKLGTMYHEVGSGLQALRFYQEALTQHGVIYDKMLESMITKSIAMCCSALGQYKSAFEHEKRAYNIYNTIFGENHELTVSSSNSLKQFMKHAVDQGSKLLAEQQSNKNKQVLTATTNTIKTEKGENDSKENLDSTTNATIPTTKSSSSSNPNEEDNNTKKKKPKRNKNKNKKKN